MKEPKSEAANPDGSPALASAHGSAPLPHFYAYSTEKPARKLWDEDDLRDYAADALKESKLALLTWAVARWQAEVSQRPLTNVHRRTLDDTWRQVIRFAGGNPTELVGPAHDDLVSPNADFRRGGPEGDKNTQSDPPSPARNG